MAQNPNANPNRLIALAGATIAIAAGSTALYLSQNGEKTPSAPATTTEHVLPATTKTTEFKGYDNLTDPRSIETRTVTKDGVTFHITP